MILSPHRRPQIKNCWTLNVKTFCNMTYQISKYFETVQNDPVNQQWHGQKGKCVIQWLMFRMKLLILEEWSDLLSPGSVIQRQVLICGGNALNIGGRGGSSVSFSSLLDCPCWSISTNIHICVPEEEVSICEFCFKPELTAADEPHTWSGEKWDRGDTWGTDGSCSDKRT